MSALEYGNILYSEEMLYDLDLSQPPKSLDEMLNDDLDFLIKSKSNIKIQDEL